MSALTSVLALALWGVGLLAPPALPPEPDDRAQPGPDGSGDPPATPPGGADTNLAPPVDGATPPGRTSLPPGLQPVPFPLEQQRRADPPPTNDGGQTGEGSADTSAPPSVPPEQPPRRSIVDLRDPFDRPPPRPRGPNEASTSRLLMPDLKDPFAPGVRRVRSKRLDMYVPNDIRDPFRTRPRADGPRPPCVKTTDDGTVVQAPGKKKATLPDCHPAAIDLRDPFTRER